MYETASAVWHVPNIPIASHTLLQSRKMLMYGFKAIYLNEHIVLYGLNGF